jgi:HSP20 family protein
MVFMRFDSLRMPGSLPDHVNGRARAARTLPVEMLRRGDHLVIAVDVAGVDPRDIEITVESNVVEIGTRRLSLHQEGDEVIVDERTHGEFRRHLFLGVDVDPGAMTAACEQGVLTLTIPRSQASKPRKVQIDNADEGRQALRSGSDRQQTINV